jgi:hypothetical protein
MDYRDFDHLVRSMADGISRRSVLRRAAGSAITSPLALVGISLMTPEAWSFLHPWCRAST